MKKLTLLAKRNKHDGGRFNGASLAKILIDVLLGCAIT